MLLQLGNLCSASLNPCQCCFGTDLKCLVCALISAASALVSNVCCVCVMQTDPTRFLSGSDDGTVRLWSIADESAVACIDSKANVCSVQFSPTDSNLMAFGSANYRVYLYDLRQVSVRLVDCCLPALDNGCQT